MNRLQQVKNSLNKNMIGKVKILDKELVETTLNAVKILSKHDQQIKIIVNQQAITLSHLADNYDEFLIFNIYINDKNKTDIENMTNYYNLSVIVDSLEFLKAIQTVKDFEKIISFEFHPHKDQPSQSRNSELKIVNLKFKSKSEHNSVFSTEINCNYIEEKVDYRYEIKNYFFKLNSDNLEKIITFVKYYKPEFVLFIFHEKSIELVIDQVEKNRLNCDFLIKGDNHNYETSFKELCELKGFRQKDYSRTILTFRFHLNLLSLIGSRFLSEDEYLYLTYQVNTLSGVEKDSIKSQYLKKNNNNRYYDIIMLSNINIEKLQEDSKKKEILESIKNGNNSDIGSLRNRINDPQTQKSIQHNKDKKKNLDIIEKCTETQKSLNDFNIKNNPNNPGNNSNQFFRLERVELKAEENIFSKKRNFERKKVDFSKEPAEFN